MIEYRPAIKIHEYVHASNEIERLIRVHAHQAGATEAKVALPKVQGGIPDQALGTNDLRLERGNHVKLYPIPANIADGLSVFGPTRAGDLPAGIECKPSRRSRRSMLHFRLHHAKSTRGNLDLYPRNSTQSTPQRCPRSLAVGNRSRHPRTGYGSAGWKSEDLVCGAVHPPQPPASSDRRDPGPKRRQVGSRPRGKETC